MTATVHKPDERLGDCRLVGGTALVGLRPEPASRLGHAATIDYRGTLRPTFICRTHKAPIPRGHRTYLEVGR